MSVLAETVVISDIINCYLLENLTDDQLTVKVEKSKTPVGHFCHIHNVRLLWIKAITGGCEIEKLDEKTAGRKQIDAGLKESGAAISALIAEAVEKGVRIKGFKPSTEAFVGYLCAHDSFHRAQIELILRQAGMPISDKIAYGMWEWGSR